MNKLENLKPWTVTLQFGNWSKTIYYRFNKLLRAKGYKVITAGDIDKPDKIMTAVELEAS